MQVWQSCTKPLIIASSGGGGHISAAQSLIQELEKNSQQILTYHQYQKPSSGLLSFENSLHVGCQLYHIPGWQLIMQKLALVQLPTALQLQQEIEQLHQNNTKPRPYVDFMLDIMPNGYAFTALFNYLQKMCDGTSLNQVVQHQHFLDIFYHKQTVKKIYCLLIDALRQRQPYDSILCTQPIGLPAICQAVSRYNKNRLHAPEIKLHLFITDIPHQQALHYLTPIHKLDAFHKKSLILHLLDLADDNILLEKKHADKIFRYAPSQNPMVRDPFRSFETISPYGTRMIRIQDTCMTFKPKEKVAVILLSSANGSTSMNYIEALIESKIEHIIVTGKASNEMTEKLARIETNTTQIYCPGFMQAPELSQVIRHANIIVTKGGGLSLMELAAINLAPKSLIAIHQEPNKPSLIWEEGNIQWFIKYNQQQQRQAFISHPNRLAEQLMGLHV